MPHPQANATPNPMRKIQKIAQHLVFMDNARPCECVHPPHQTEHKERK